MVNELPAAIANKLAALREAEAVERRWTRHRPLPTELSAISRCRTTRMHHLIDNGSLDANP